MGRLGNVDSGQRKPGWHWPCGRRMTATKLDLAADSCSFVHSLVTPKSGAGRSGTHIECLLQEFMTPAASSP